MSVTLREGHRLRVFQDRFLWKILGPKRKAVIGDRGKLLSQEFHDLILNHMHTLISRGTLISGTTSPGLRNMAPERSSVWNLLYVALLAPSILNCVPDFWKICAPLRVSVIRVIK